MVNPDSDIRMGRQSCYGASGKRNPNWLEHIRWVHVAIRTFKLSISTTICWHHFTPQKS